MSRSWGAGKLKICRLSPCRSIPGDIDVVFIDEFDEHASLIGAKGIGELGATGVAAAVASAVHDAIGVRIRKLPITPEKLVRI
jgi:xanthine dehydrogenase YagR molybdenum-binding subunit